MWSSNKMLFALLANVVIAVRTEVSGDRSSELNMEEIRDLS